MNTLIAFTGAVLAGAFIGMIAFVLLAAVRRTWCAFATESEHVVFAEIIPEDENSSIEDTSTSTRLYC